MEQEIRFCMTPDRVRIAYSAVGQGPSLVFPPPWLCHLQLEWDEPAGRIFWEKLARHHTIVRFDKWGCGLSDRNRTDFSLEAELRILGAVVDHLKLKRFALFGISQGGPVAVAYAAKYPRRVSHLILYGTWARLDRTKSPLRSAFTALARTHWGFGSKALAENFLPGASAAAIEWFAKMQREAVTAEMVIPLMDLSYDLDVTAVAPRLRVPTLVMHRRGDLRIPFELGTELAALVPNARFVPLEGEIHRLFHGDADSSLRAIAAFFGDSVDSAPVVPSEQVTAPSRVASQDDPAAQEARYLIFALNAAIVLSRFRVVGGYTRYDEAVRHALKDARQKIAAAFDRPSRKRENHVIWASPGSGKTYFVQQVAASLAKGIRYNELNLAKCNEQEFRAGLGELDAAKEPCLCFVDEIDAKPQEAWPYEVLLPYLDASVDRGAWFAFVLAGSSGSSLGEMKQRISSRPKGTDLLSRVPTENEYVIPSMSFGDRVLVVLSQFRQAGQELSRDIRAVEKIGLYYVALSPRLGNARQLREFAVRAVERTPAGDDRVKYDHLFSPGDPENKAFWMRALPVAGDLVNKFVTLED